jgi:hypothetical protein
VDAASVAVPTIHHAQVGCRLLELGIDILVEKPMAASVAEADRLLEAARRYNRVLQVGHLERFNRPGRSPAWSSSLYTLKCTGWGFFPRAVWTWTSCTT